MSLEQQLSELKLAVEENTKVLLKCLEVRLNGAAAAGVTTTEAEEPKAETTKRTRAAKATTTEAVETPAAEVPETTEPEAETPAVDPAAGYKSANNLTPATPGEERAPDPVVDDAATEDKLILEITNTVRSAITRDKNTAGDVKLAWRDICKSLGVDTIADLKGKGRTKDLGHALSRAREL